MGKDWAHGLTKWTDPRIARAAASHMGLSYVRRTELEGRSHRRKWPLIRIPGIDGEWSAALAYAIGLLATDGGLGGRKTVTFTSKDLDLIETFKKCIGAEAPVGRNTRAYRVQISDVRFYRWLESIGITARKSLTLGALNVPQGLLAHLVRGLLDGDGSIYTGFTTPNRARYPDHRYQRLQVRFHSASRKHLEWLQAELRDSLGLTGWIGTQHEADPARRRAAMYILRYAKHESLVLLLWLYADSGAPRLERKWQKWIAFTSEATAVRRYRHTLKSDPACDN